MTTVNKAVYNKALEMFPFLKETVVRYSPLGKRTVQIETKDHKQYVFYYKNEKEWDFQTMASYVNNQYRG